MRDIVKEIERRDEKTRMLYWWPKIKDLDIPMPRTIIVPLEKTTINEEEIQDIIYIHFEEIMKAIRKIGFPVFIRTDILSGKYSFEKSCYLPKEENVKKHLWEIIFAGLEADIIGHISKAIIVREYIEPIWKFKAFQGLPIGKERRYFINSGKVQCHHAYWIEDAIKFWQRIDKIDFKNLKSLKDIKPQEPKNWKEELKILNRETKEEVKLIMSYTKKVIDAGFTGYWSIDFMYGKDGNWYLIDMAEGDVSWHPECKFKKN